MGNRKWKEAFSILYEPPAFQKKGAFLERLEPPGLSTGEFLFSQLFYLRPWSWLLAVAIFAAALFLMKNRLPEQIRLVSVLLPFAALSTVTELHRSARCRMEELEMASRFSLKTLLLARLTLLGLGNLLLLCALFPLMTGWGQLSLAETGFYLLCPYCLTSLLCLMVTRRFRGSESVYLCAGTAAAVSVLCSMWQEKPPVLFQGAGYAWVTLLLLALMIWEYRRYLFCGEELVWN